MVASVDRREQILSRILAILGGIDGIVMAVRDWGDIPPKETEDGTTQLPAAVLLDGEETNTLKTVGHSPGQRMPATVVGLRPQIWVVPLPSDTIKNVGIPAFISQTRIKVLKALINDETLLSLMGANGGMEYLGMKTDMQSGSTMEGNFMLDCMFNYTFNPAQL